MELLLVVPLALVAGVVTLVLCDLAGGIARAKGRSYWLFFALGLLLWFPSLVAALALPARTEPAGGPAPGRVETAVGLLLLLVAALAVAAGLGVAVAYAP